MWHYRHTRRLHHHKISQAILLAMAKGVILLLLVATVLTDFENSCSVVKLFVAQLSYKLPYVGGLKCSAWAMLTLHLI